MLPGKWCNNDVACSTLQWDRDIVTDALWPANFGVKICGGKKSSLPYPSRPALGPPIQWVLWLLPLGQSSWGVEMTTHNQLALRLK